MCTYTCFHICMCMGGPMCTQTLIPYSVILFSKTQSMLQVLWRNVQKIWAAFHTHTCMTYGRNVTKKFFDLALLLLIPLKETIICVSEKVLPQNNQHTRCIWRSSTKDFWNFYHCFVLLCYLHSVVKYCSRKRRNMLTLWQQRITKLLPFALQEGKKWYYFPCENAQDIMGKRKKYLVKMV